MEIVIHCDQTDCEFNKTQYAYENSIPEPQYNMCIHPRPKIVITFGETISDEIRKCHSKSKCYG